MCGVCARERVVLVVLAVLVVLVMTELVGGWVVGGKHEHTDVGQHAFRTT